MSEFSAEASCCQIQIWQVRLGGARDSAFQTGSQEMPNQVPHLEEQLMKDFHFQSCCNVQIPFLKAWFALCWKIITVIKIVLKGSQNHLLETVTDKAEVHSRKGSLWLGHQEEGKATQLSAHLLPDETLGSSAKQRRNNI